MRKLAALTLRYSLYAEAADVLAESPDVVIIATGRQWAKHHPTMKGTRQIHVVISLGYIIG